MRTKRRFRQKQGAQAVVEMALVLPLIFILIFNFIAVMVMVVYQQKLEAGVNIGTTAVLTVPLGAGNQGLLVGQQSFNGTFGTTGGTPSLPSFVQVTSPFNCPDANSQKYFTGSVNYNTNLGVSCSATV